MEAPERNLALDLVRVTESAALASARWLGRGDKNAGDKAAVDAMRLSFNSLNIRGTVVIGEGEKDEAPMLYNGEAVGSGQGPAVDVAVDPVEGTRLLAYGRPNAISVVGLAPAGTMYAPGASYYMKKLVVPAAASHVIGHDDLDAPVGETLRKVAKALGKDLDDIVVFVLDKPRHETLIRDIRAAGARIQLHTDGDVNGSLMAVDDRAEVDVMLGTGGTPEGVLSACAIRGIGGRMVCRLDPQSDAERQRLRNDGVDLDRVLLETDLVSDDNVFFAATGLSGGSFLRGVRYHGRGAVTHSLVIRGKTGTVRYIESNHNWDKLMRVSSVQYD
ncbi:MAG: class II fructose-bisphosphatase [Desulfovibrio sp.]|nr:class II fructose-bisphosphatase [Desulfovibrio sp.]